MVVGRELLLEDLVVERLVVVVGRELLLEDLVVERLVVVVGRELLLEDLVVERLVVVVGRVVLLEDLVVERLVVVVGRVVPRVVVLDLVFVRVVDLLWLYEFNRFLLLYAELLLLKFLFPLI